MGLRRKPLKYTDLGLLSNSLTSLTRSPPFVRRLFGIFPLLWETWTNQPSGFCTVLLYDPLPPTLSRPNPFKNKLGPNPLALLLIQLALGPIGPPTYFLKLNVEGPHGISPFLPGMGILWDRNTEWLLNLWFQILISLLPRIIIAYLPVNLSFLLIIST